MLYVASVSSTGATTGHRRGGSLGHMRSRPRVRMGSQAGAIAGVEHKVVSMSVAAGVEHEAASMLSCSLSLPLFQIDAVGQQ
jgi:hypothetical protein